MQTYIVLIACVVLLLCLFSEYLYIFLYLQRLLHTFYFRQVLLRQSSHRESAVESRAFHYWQFRFSSVRESL